VSATGTIRLVQLLLTIRVQRKLFVRLQHLQFLTGTSPTGGSSYVYLWKAVLQVQLQVLSRS
jgi:hypothetical protein